jgi:transcription initiation factor IIE alpha subunit
MKDRYVNLFTDFGFKKIFGEELNKELLKDFLNQLLKVAESLIREGLDDDRIARTTGLSLEEIRRLCLVRS